ncbi:MAG: M56 family metallopeptidase [Planctomycetes bacterium]|nr:M56 family metallopeptidase [Planctomycetota bacterium]
MIDYLQSSMFWCVLQVSVIALAGIAASIVIARHNPTAACSITCVTVAAAAMLTSLAPVPAHRMLSVKSAITTLPFGSVSEVTLRNSTPTRTHAQSQHDRSESVTLDLSQLAAKLQLFVVKTNLSAQRDRATVRLFGWCFGTIIVLGLARLVHGIAFVVRTRRMGEPVTERRVELLLKAITSQFSCRAVPAVRASEHLSSAAVAGWIRPALILPKGWKLWSDEELRAVIAHEVAHIVRRDSLWRAIAACVSAMHFYNPLVHWLLRRVMLYQELAADELAVTVVGRRCYLRSLSKLAIRRDEQIRCNGRPDLLPVFSGHLMRRIKMLRSKDGSSLKTDSKQRTLWTAVASTAIITLGVATLAVRGFAEPPTNSDNESDKPTVRIARARAAEKAPPASDSIEKLFLRQPLSPTTIAPNNTGMIVVRVRELLELPELKPYVALLNESLPQLIESAVLGTDVGPIDLGAIEWIAGQAVLTTRNVKDGPNEEQKGAVMFGGRSFIIKLNRDFDLTSWINGTDLEAAYHVIEGRDVFAITIPTLGPYPTWLSMTDSKTLLATHAQVDVTDETTLSDIFPAASENGNTMTARWSDTWKRTEGGIISVLCTNAEFYDSPPPAEAASELEKAAAELTRDLQVRCHNFAFGFDVTPDSSSLGVRLRLSHAGRGPATKSAQEITGLFELVQETPNDEADLSDNDRDWLDMYGLAMEKVVITTDKLNDGTTDVVLTTQLPFEHVVRLFWAASADELDSGSTDE